MRTEYTDAPDGNSQLFESGSVKILSQFWFMITMFKQFLSKLDNPNEAT